MASHLFHVHLFKPLWLPIVPSLHGFPFLVWNQSMFPIYTFYFLSWFSSHHGFPCFKSSRYDPTVVSKVFHIYIFLWQAISKAKLVSASISPSTAMAPKKAQVQKPRTMATTRAKASFAKKVMKATQKSAKAMKAMKAKGDSKNEPMLDPSWIFQDWHEGHLCALPQAMGWIIPRGWRHDVAGFASECHGQQSHEDQEPPRRHEGHEGHESHESHEGQVMEAHWIGHEDWPSGLARMVMSRPRHSIPPTGMWPTTVFAGEKNMCYFQALMASHMCLEYPWFLLNIFFHQAMMASHVHCIMTSRLKAARLQWSPCQAIVASHYQAMMASHHCCKSHYNFHWWSSGWNPKVVEEKIFTIISKWFKPPATSKILSKEFFKKYKQSSDKPNICVLFFKKNPQISM